MIRVRDADACTSVVLWASRCSIHRGARVLQGVENDRGREGAGCGEPHNDSVAYAAIGRKRGRRKKLRAGARGRRCAVYRDRGEDDAIVGSTRVAGNRAVHWPS